MRAGFHSHPAEKARQCEIILRRPWQKIVFFGGLAVPLVVVLTLLLFTATGH